MADSSTTTASAPAQPMPSTKDDFARLILEQSEAFQKQCNESMDALRQTISDSVKRQWELTNQFFENFKKKAPLGTPLPAATTPTPAPTVPAAADPKAPG